MNTLEARRRLLGRNVYKRTTEGNPAIAQGSLARRDPGITMQGWTEQDSTDGTNLIDYTQAAARTENQSVEIIDGGVKWTGDYYFIISVTGLEKNQTYTMHYVSNDAGAWVFGYTDGTYSTQQQNGGSITTDPEKDCNKVSIYKSNPTVSGQDMVFTDIMLNAGFTALPYEPYTGGQPSPSPDYPQEIVSAGNWNEEAQKWEYEITIANAQTDPDKNQTVTLTADRPLTKWDRLEKRNGQWGWVYKSGVKQLISDMGIIKNTEGTYQVAGFAEADRNRRAEALSTHFIYKLSTTEYGVFWFDSAGTDLRFRMSQFQTVEEVKDWLQENEVYFTFPNATETFIPLSTTEQEQMNALHTFRPTTVLSNDCGCSMSLTYKTKKSMEVTT